MNGNESPYPFGYLFSDQKINVKPDYYNEEVIIEKFHYIYSGRINPYILDDGNNFIIIHGEFLHIGIDYQLTNEGLVNRLFKSYFDDYPAFLNLLDFIAGRYVIIIGNKDKVRAYPDASNTRSNYYSLKQNIISSHVFLINAQCNHERFQFSRELPEMKNGLLETPFNDIKSLLPNFFFDYNSKKQVRFFPRENNKYTDMDEKEKFELIERFWKEQLRYFVSKYDNLIFSLTGGGDSRFSLALSKEYLDKIQFFTYATTKKEDSSSKSAAGLSMDYKIVNQILDVVRLNHKYIYFVDDKIELSEHENFLISRNTIGRHSSFLIPQIKKHYPLSNLMHIRGNLLEIGKTRYYSNIYKESNIEEVKKVFLNRYSKSQEESMQKYVVNKFEEFVENLNYDSNIFNYHLLDLYHWEVRMGRWHSEILNTHDIIFGTISPFNHRALIDLTLSFPYEKRRDEYVFKEIINRNFSILNFFGDNELTNLYEKTRPKY